jgi:hypothetical protein
VTRDAAGFQLRLRSPAAARGHARRERVYRYLDQRGQMRVLESGFVGRRWAVQDILRVLRGDTSRAARHRGVER